jgi:hypothetical protein
MKHLMIVAALCLPLTAVSAPVFAATAHNSQAGALGPTTNNEGPTGMTKRMKQMSGKHRKHMRSM